MYALLGNIRFAGAYSPAEVRSTAGANYAEHALIEGKPRLQKLGDNLEELRLRIELFRPIVEPETALAELYRYKEQGEIISLTFGNGLVYGSFVVQTLEVDFRAQTKDGALTHATANVSLKEAYNPREATESRADAFALARNPVTLATPYGLEQTISGEFMEEVNGVISETGAVETVLQSAQADPSLEAFALADTTKRLERQEAALTSAQTKANVANSQLNAVTADFRTQVGDLFAAIDALKIAASNGLAPALLANADYQITMTRLRGLTTGAATLKALRR
jgi:phage protein U